MAADFLPSVASPYPAPDSLVVCQTEIRDLSRMCIVLRGQDGVIEQARRQLEDLVSVVSFSIIVAVGDAMSSWTRSERK